MTAHEPPGLIGAKTASHKIHKITKANHDHQAIWRHFACDCSMGSKWTGVFMRELLSF